MTREEIKAKLRHYLSYAKGDDLERAEAAFRNCTEAQLDQHYGESGHTRRWWLEGYRQHRREWQEVRDFVEGL